ncbi:hypothetical protein ACHHYP_06001 [Achlya hypogyna]|uniref:Uncharacterized protein n=1 Tax=Achlya hypogyna TaxID=1202772 RepID=A0A1V9YW15_ACHHY|nr:hypothetical protein ACHHYP_06001 [Achlya hypogyna]
MHDADVPDVHALDATAAACVAAGDPIQAMLCWERSLFLRQHYLGHDSPVVWAQAAAMCQAATDAGRRFLCTHRLDDARRFLAKAEALATTSAERVAIYNQFAAYYRRVAKLRVAYSYLQRAMQLDGATGLPAAETRLNACAVLSQLGRHDKALLAVQRALILLREAPPDAATWRACAVAYHNLAVEEEFLRKPPVQVLASYRRAVQLATEHVGVDDPLTEALAASLAAADAAWTRKKMHAVCSEARTAKAAGTKANPKPAARKLPKHTAKAYGVCGAPAAVAVPQGPGVDLSQFDDRALGDEFAMPVPAQLLPSPSADLTPMLTPRQSPPADTTHNELLHHSDAKDEAKVGAKGDAKDEAKDDEGGVDYKAGNNANPADDAKEADDWKALNDPKTADDPETAKTTGDLKGGDDSNGVDDFKNGGDSKNGEDSKDNDDFEDGDDYTNGRGDTNELAIEEEVDAPVNGNDDEGDDEADVQLDAEADLGDIE